MQTIRWGIIGAGAIARTFVKAIGREATGIFAGAASRNPASAATLCAGHETARPFANVDALLQSNDIDVVYIAAPHPAHAALSIAAAGAGKHILCEKPAGMNLGEAMAMIDAAGRAGVFFMEAFMVRCHPQTRAAIDLVRSGSLGTVRLIECSFSFGATYQPQSRLFDPALGGGGILDVGCYTVSAARLLAGAALGQGAIEPTEVKGSAVLNPSGTDSCAAATLLFPGGILAQVLCGTELAQAHRIHVHGTRATLTLDNPWFPGNGSGSLTVRTHDGRIESSTPTPADDGAYAYEAAVVCQCIRAGKVQAEAPAPDWADTLANARTLDRWRESAGLLH